MAKVKVKPIHLIEIWWNNECTAICDSDVITIPIEATNKKYCRRDISKGTFNPQKVTCKRCLKHPQYKEAMDRVKYPLFFLKENSHA